MSSISGENKRKAEDYIDHATELYNTLVRSGSNDIGICDQIIEACDKALQYGENPDAYTLLSRAIHLKATNIPMNKERERELFMAINFAAKAIRLAPQVADLHFWKAGLLFEQVSFSKSKEEVLVGLDDAEKEYKTTLEFDPNHQGALSSLKEIKEKREKLKTVPDHEEDPNALRELAWMLFFKKDWGKLREICEKILKLETKGEESEAIDRKLLASSLIGLSFEDKQSAQLLRQKAIEESKKAILLFGASGNADRVSEAYDIHGTALKLSSISIESREEKIRMVRETISAYEKAVQLNPKSQKIAEHLQDTKELLSTHLKDAKKGGCFIATTVYGNDYAPDVVIFKRFRDDYLLSSAIGRAIVKIYYTISPSIAKSLQHREKGCQIVRCAFLHPIANLCRSTLYKKGMEYNR